MVDGVVKMVVSHESYFSESLILESYSSDNPGDQEQLSTSRDFDSQDGSSSSKKRKVTSYDIDLENAPPDEVHPLLQNRTMKEKQAANSKKGRPRK